MDPIEIVRRVDGLKAQRSNVEFQWNDVEAYIMPLRIGNLFTRPQSEQSIEWNRDNVYDSTAIHAAQKFASAMHGAITNPSFKWFQYAFRDDELAEDPDSVEWIQQVTDRIYDALYDSNFDSEISSAYQDLVGPGNAIMTAEAEKEDPNDWQGINFSAIPIREMFFERDHKSRLHRVYRWLEWTAMQIKTKFPDITLPPQVQACLEPGGNADTRFDVIFAIYARDDKFKNRGNMGVLAPKERPFGCQYVMKATKERIGEEDGYYEMPAFLAQWERTSGSQWGHGPGVIMAPTVKYLNRWMELEDLAIRKMVDPASLVLERGLLSDLDLAPGGMTVVRDLNGIKPYESNAKVNFSNMKLEELRKMIREAFHNDELQLRDSPQMSATEAQIRYELMNRVLGPTMGRIQNDLLDPLIDRVFKLLWRNKQLPAPPTLVIQKRAQFKITYYGPLVRAQKADEVASIERFVGQIGALAKVFPTILAVLDPIKVARELAERTQVPGDMLKSESEVKQALAEAAKAQAQQMQAQQMQQQGEAMQAHGEGKQAMDAAQQANPQEVPQ